MLKFFDIPFMFHKENHLIGRGVYSDVYRRLTSDQVVKLTRGNGSRMDSQTGLARYHRALHDLELQKEYLPDYLLPTRVRTLQGRSNIFWYYQQVYTNCSTVVSSDNFDLDIYRQILDVFEKTEKMRGQVGFGFDWFGSGIYSKLIHIFRNSNYWIIPNLVMDETGQLKLFDSGLLWTGELDKNSVPPNIKIDPNEPLTWKVTEKFLTYTLRRIERQLSNSQQLKNTKIIPIMQE